jgi:radical SAM superfamily enzyme with C-terminal helix-hairpin-helix motif
MIKPIKYILILILAISCSNNVSNKTKKPDNLIPKDSMVEIIYDVSIINSAKGINKTILENKGIIPEDYIYKKHNIDSLQFALSNEYYAYELKTYETIYDSVKAKLQRDRTYYQVIIDAEKKIRDSLNTKLRRERAIKDSLKEIQGLGKSTKIKATNLKKPRPLKKIDTSEQSIHQ